MYFLKDEDYREKEETGNQRHLSGFLFSGFVKDEKPLKQNIKQQDLNRI